MKYRTRSLNILQQSLRKESYTKVDGWDEDINRCWIRYINGANRKELIKDTRFSSYISVKYHLRKHPCYSKIAKLRKRWFRSVNAVNQFNLHDYPWLLGVYYADGSRHNGTQLSFALTKNELIIAERIRDELKTILGEDYNVIIEKIDNMYNVRIHGVELCDAFPDKKNESDFLSLWNIMKEEDKLKFVAGLIDGDGSCSFEDGIYSIGLFIKSVPFLLEPIKRFLSNYGYVSSKDCSVYISPTVGHILYKYTMKRFIVKPYQGSVDIEKAFNLLKEGCSLHEIGRKMSFDKKTISIALRREFGKEADKYIEQHRK